MSKSIGKEKLKKATFKDILAAAALKKKNAFKSKDILVPSMRKTMLFVKPSEDKLFELLDEMQGNKSHSEQIAFLRKLIFWCCPQLQDQELQEEVGVVDPYDIVKEIFEIDDLTAISDELTPLLNVGSVVEADKEIKN